MANGFRAAVPPITGEPSPYGLLGGCVEVVNATDTHELNGTDLMPSACGAVNSWQDCPDPAFPNPTSKIFDPTTTCEFDPVTLYAGVRCGTFGLGYDEGQTLAADRLRLGEQRALEDHFARRWLALHADDITPASGAVNVAQGVGLLEGWLADTYGGQGLLHVPAGAAALMGCCNVVTRTREVNCPETLMGNGVVFGAGYNINVGPPVPPATTPTPAGPCQAWLYITPPVRVRRDTPQLTFRNEGQSIDTTVNTRYALAESTFVVEVACCDAAAVLVELCTV
jgi:hypothetical protein